MPEVDVPVAAVPTSVEGLTEGAEPLDFLDQSQSPSTGDRAATSRVHKKSASIWGEAVGELKTSAKGKARVASKFAIKAAIGLAALIVLCSGVAFLGNLARSRGSPFPYKGIPRGSTPLLPAAFRSSTTSRTLRMKLRKKCATLRRRIRRSKRLRSKSN